MSIVVERSRNTYILYFSRSTNPIRRFNSMPVSENSCKHSKCCNYCSVNCTAHFLLSSIIVELCFYSTVTTHHRVVRCSASQISQTHHLRHHRLNEQSVSLSEVTRTPMMIRTPASGRWAVFRIIGYEIGNPLSKSTLLLCKQACFSHLIRLGNTYGLVGGLNLWCQKSANTVTGWLMHNLVGQ